MELFLVLLLGFIASVHGEGTQVDVSGEQASILKYHNSKRTGEGVKPLTWSDAVAGEAGTWAATCHFEHQMGAYGENLAYVTGSGALNEKLTKSMDAWYAEKSDLTVSTNCEPSACHFTQMSWYDTASIGCAVQQCPSLASGATTIADATYVVCFYDPPGNWIGEEYNTAVRRKRSEVVTKRRERGSNSEKRAERGQNKQKRDEVHLDG